MTTFFTSDHHFFHKNVIDYCSRPFSSLEEMHERLVENWNRVVQPNDTVYHLGDMFMTSRTIQANAILKQLNGRLYVIPGNHDQDLWNRVIKHELNTKGYPVINLGGYHEFNCSNEGAKVKIILCHYPLRTWNKSHHGSLHLHGHCHGYLDEENKFIRRMDVGVDSSNYYPISLGKVLETLLARPVGIHHVREE